MRNLFVAFVVLIALAAPAAHADVPYVKLPATITAKPGAYFAVKADTNCKSVKWLIPDTLTAFPADALKDANTPVVCGSPGTYTIRAYGALADQASDIASCVVTIVGADPAPAPAPAPTPADKPAWALLIIDNNARTPAIAQLVTSPTLPAGLLARGVGFRVLDVSDPLVKRLNYQPFVESAGGAPALVLLTADGKKVKAIKLPPDEASLLAEVGPAPVTSRSVVPIYQCGPAGCPTCPARPSFLQEISR